MYNGRFVKSRKERSKEAGLRAADIAETEEPDPGDYSGGAMLSERTPRAGVPKALRVNDKTAETTKRRLSAENRNIAAKQKRYAEEDAFMRRREEEAEKDVAKSEENSARMAALPVQKPNSEVGGVVTVAPKRFDAFGTAENERGKDKNVLEVQGGLDRVQENFLVREASSTGHGEGACSGCESDSCDEQEQPFVCNWTVGGEG
jgi:hypothetical protein